MPEHRREVGWGSVLLHVADMRAQVEGASVFYSLCRMRNKEAYQMRLGKKDVNKKGKDNWRKISLSLLYLFPAISTTYITVFLLITIAQVIFRIHCSLEIFQLE